MFAEGAGCGRHGGGRSASAAGTGACGTGGCCEHNKKLFELFLFNSFFFIK